MEESIWIVTCGLVGAAAIIATKLFVDTKDNKWFYAATLIEIFLVCCHVQLFKQGRIEVLFTIARIMAVLLVVFAGVLFFSRKKTTWKLWLGVAFSVFAVLLLVNS